MIVEDEALACLVRALEKQGSGQPADAATDDHMVNVLVWSYAVHADLREAAISQPVTFLNDGPRVPVGIRVVTDAAVAVEGSGRRVEFMGWREALHQQGRRSHECRVEKVSPCDSPVHSQQP